jgi:hypothetical protein
MATCSSCRWTGYCRQCEWSPPTVHGSRPHHPARERRGAVTRGDRLRTDEALVRFVPAIGETGAFERNPPLRSPHEHRQRECPLHARKEHSCHRRSHGGRSPSCTGHGLRGCRCHRSVYGSISCDARAPTPLSRMSTWPLASIASLVNSEFARPVPSESTSFVRRHRGGRCARCAGLAQVASFGTVVRWTRCSALRSRGADRRARS